MTEREFKALVDLITRLSICSAGVLQGSEHNRRIMNNAISTAYEILVKPNTQDLTDEDYKAIYGWGGQDQL